MCGRFYIEDDFSWTDTLALLCALNRRLPEGVRRAGEICPSETAAVIALGRRGAPGVFAMRWGYSLPDSRLVINARSETAAARPLFRDGIARRRCAVPASCYFEWDRSGREKTKYAVRRTDGGMMLLAGIYRLCGPLAEFAVLTRPAAESVAGLHDRMPVLLSAELAARWVRPDADVRPLLACAAPEVAAELAGSAPRQIGMEL